MKPAALVLLSVVVFLLGAKGHGRQLRLERELEGHFNVTFGGTNPPFVEALWAGERVRFWGTALVAAALLVGLFAWARQLDSGALLVILWAPSIAFAVTGAMSARRLAIAVRDPAKNGGGTLVGAARTAWIRKAFGGSLGWWLPMIGLAVAMAVLARGD